jgi:hypothetical protein
MQPQFVKNIYHESTFCKKEFIINEHFVITMHKKIKNKKFVKMILAIVICEVAKFIMNISTIIICRKKNHP